MTHSLTPRDAYKIARRAGGFYLLIAVFGGFSIGYVPMVIVASGDAGQTAINLTDNFDLYRAGLFADLVVIVSEIILTVLLYQLLKPVGQTLSMIAALARFSMVLVMAINLFLGVIPGLLLTNAAFSTGLDGSQIQVFSLLLFEARQFGVYIWGVLFGLHLAILGVLVIRSGYFPRILGWMMVIGSLGYLIEGISKITFVESGALTMVITGLLVIVTIEELAFAIWLMVKGVRLHGFPSPI